MNPGVKGFGKLDPSPPQRPPEPKDPKRTRSEGKQDLRRTEEEGNETENSQTSHDLGSKLESGIGDSRDVSKIGGVKEKGIGRAGR
jgi:hypothetical protein